VFIYQKKAHFQKRKHKQRDKNSSRGFGEKNTLCLLFVQTVLKRRKVLIFIFQSQTQPDQVILLLFIDSIDALALVFFLLTSGAGEMNTELMRPHSPALIISAPQN